MSGVWGASCRQPLPFRVLRPCVCVRICICKLSSSLSVSNPSIQSVHARPHPCGSPSLSTVITPLLLIVAGARPDDWTNYGLWSSGQATGHGSWAAPLIGRWHETRIVGLLSRRDRKRVRHYVMYFRRSPSIVCTIYNPDFFALYVAHGRALGEYLRSHCGLCRTLSDMSSMLDNIMESGASLWNCIDTVTRLHNL